MNSNRLWTIGALVVIIALFAGTWFLGASPRLSEASVADSDREAVEGQNAVQSVKLAALRKQFEEIDTLKAELVQARISIPSTANLAPLISHLSKLAAEHPVTLTSVTFDEPTPYVASDTADPQLLSAMGSVTPEAFLIIPVQISMTGKYGAAMDFIDALQHSDRLFLVHDLILSDGSMAADSDAELNISGQVFVLLDPEKIAADAAAIAAEAAEVTAAAEAAQAAP